MKIAEVKQLDTNELVEKIENAETASFYQELFQRSVSFLPILWYQVV